MDGVAISIIGRPRPLPSHDTPNAAHNTYTLKCEEPVKLIMLTPMIAGSKASFADRSIMGVLVSMPQK